MASPHGVARVICGCTAVPPVPLYGPGSELVSLICELGADPNNHCDCAAKAAQMNAWGVAGCREHRAEIVAWLWESAWKQWITTQASVAWEMRQEPWFKLLDPLGSLVDEAIRRAEENTKNPPTVEQVLSVVADGPQPAAVIREALAIPAPEVMVAWWLDQMVRDGDLARLTTDGVKQYGRNARCETACGVLQS